ncbi:MAG: hypothetical protein ACI4VM_07580 [Anaerovoracaceae bacterium]
MEQERKSYVGYEYKEITVGANLVSMYLDCYENFGWIAEEELPDMAKPHQATIRMKRDRKIINKMELTRLQRNFEACAHDLSKLEKAKTSAATAWALAAGIAGTVFMAGATFAVTHEPPVIWLCVLLAIPGFAGWILPYFIYRKVLKKQTEKLQPLMDEKMEEIYQVCEKGHSLLL